MAAGAQDVSLRPGAGVHAGGVRDGAGREQAAMVLSHGPDGDGAGGDESGRDAGVGGLSGGVW